MNNDWAKRPAAVAFLNRPTIDEFTVWVRETQIPNEPVTVGVLAVLFGDFMRERDSDPHT